ncbi:adenosine deaminase domain-containing protein 2-like isoform X2 [Bufo gargarizans]|nr:adenosine deaminase domain-containing protein 2-like isoform X2 [Bufo gargarizans]
METLSLLRKQYRTDAGQKQLGEVTDQMIAHEDRCAAVANDTYHRLVGDSEYYKHRSNLAAFILQRDVVSQEEVGDVYEVVALGTGATWYQGWQDYHGLLVHDCHAVVIARRALLRYLYKEVALYYSKVPGATEKSIFCPSQQTQSLVLKPNTFFHLYLSRVPEEATPSVLSWREQTGVHLSIHAKGSTRRVSECPPSILNTHVCCMSVTDKLLKWSALGVQGALLSQFVDPLYITSIITGSKRHQMEALSQALDRLHPPLDMTLFRPYSVCSPYLLIVPEINSNHSSPIHPSHSLNWTKGDKNVENIDATTGQTVEKPFSLPPSTASRLCKAAMLMYYMDVQNSLGKQQIQDSYYHAKVSSDQYQRAKTLLYSQLNTYGHGVWPRKLCVDRFRASTVQGPDGDSWVRFQWELH